MELQDRAGVHHGDRQRAAPVDRLVRVLALIVRVVLRDQAARLVREELLHEEGLVQLHLLRHCAAVAGPQTELLTGPERVALL